MIKVLIAAQSAIDVMALLLLSFVRPIKIGSVPKGFIRENNAAKLIKNKLMLFCVCFCKAKC